MMDGTETGDTRKNPAKPPRLKGGNLHPQCCFQGRLTSSQQSEVAIKVFFPYPYDDRIPETFSIRTSFVTALGNEDAISYGSLSHKKRNNNIM
jgi:hypothetical protein